MKNLLFGTLAFSALLVSHGSMAAEQTVKLSVPGMSCVSCPYIVKSAISAVSGVSSVTATMADLSATVTFDDEITTLVKIQQATADVGYPSSLFGGASGS